MTDLYDAQSWLMNRSYREMAAMKAAISGAMEKGIESLRLTMNMGAIKAEIARRERL